MPPVRNQDRSKATKVNKSKQSEELEDGKNSEKDNQNVKEEKKKEEITTDGHNSSLTEHDETSIDESEEEEETKETTEIRKIFAEHLSPIIAEKANFNKLEKIKKKERNKSLKEAVNSEMTVESGNETSDSESSDALHIDQSNDDREEDMEKILEEKAAKNNLTAANVKSILHQVITNKDVVSMVKNTLTSIVNAGGSLEGVYEPKMTRAKTKEVIEQGKIPEVWALTPVKKPVKEKPSFLEMQFSDDEDDEYKPEKDKEAMLGDSDDESMLSSHASDFGSPYPLTPSTPGVRPSHTSSSSDFFTSPKTPSRRSVKTDLGQAFDQVADEKEGETVSEMELDDDTIARRTRSKLPLTTTSLLELESTFVAPDITEDMYDTLCDDKNWQEFLGSLIKTDDVPTQEATDDDNNDPEYDYLGEAEHEERDEEDYRFGKMYRIPKTEILDLLSQLTEWTASDQEEEEEVTKTDTGGESVETDDQKRQRRLSAKPVVVFDNFTTSQRLILEDQMRRHVQLSAQLCILCSGSTEYDDVSKECVRHLDELDMFRQASLAGSKSVFNACNLTVALELVKEKRQWDLESELMEIKQQIADESSDRSDSESENDSTDFTGKRSRAVKTLLRSQKDIFWNSAVFLYPDILPTCRLLSKEDGMRTFYTSGEDKLIVLGMDQFGATPRHYDLIQKYLLPAKSRKQIYCRIKNLSRKIAPDNPIKRYREHKILPENAVILNTFSLSKMIAPKYQPLQLLPKWCKKFKNELESRLNIESKALEDTLVETLDNRPEDITNVESDSDDDPGKRYYKLNKKQKKRARSRLTEIRKRRESKKTLTKTDLNLLGLPNGSLPTAILTSNGLVVPIRFSSPTKVPASDLANAVVSLDPNANQSPRKMDTSPHCYDGISDASHVQPEENKQCVTVAMLPVPESGDRLDNPLQTQKAILQNPSQLSVAVGETSQNQLTGVQYSQTEKTSSGAGKIPVVPNYSNVEVVQSCSSGNIPIIPNYSSSGNITIVPNYTNSAGVAAVSNTLSSASIAVVPNYSSCGNVPVVQHTNSGNVSIAPKYASPGNVPVAPKYSNSGNISIAPKRSNPGMEPIAPKSAAVVQNNSSSGKVPVVPNIVVQNSSSTGCTRMVPNYSRSGNRPIVPKPTPGNFSVVQTSVSGEVSVFQMSGILTGNVADIQSTIQVPVEVGNIPNVHNTGMDNVPIVQISENGQICIVQNSGAAEVPKVQSSDTGFPPTSSMTQIPHIQNSEITVGPVLEQPDTQLECTWSGTESFHVAPSSMQVCASVTGIESQMIQTPSSSFPSMSQYSSTVSSVDPSVTGIESQMIQTPSSSFPSMSQYSSTVSSVDPNPSCSATMTETFTQDSSQKQSNEIKNTASVEAVPGTVPIETDETSQTASDSKTIVAIPQNNLSGIVISTPVHSPAISVVHSPMPASMMDTDNKNPDGREISDEVTPSKLRDQSLNSHNDTSGYTFTTTPSSSCNTSTDSPTMCKAVEIMATLAPYYNSYLAMPAVTQQEMETTPTKRPRYRELKPKEGNTPDPLPSTSVFKMPDACLKKASSPEVKFNKQTRPILPKCLVSDGKISPTKRAANNIKRKAQKLYQKGSSPGKLILPRPPVSEPNLEPDPESTVPQVTDLQITAQEDIGAAKAENSNNSATVTNPDTTTGDKETKDEPPVPTLRRSKRKATITKTAETKEFNAPRPVIEAAPVQDDSQQEEETKTDEQDHIDELMTASTTIRFNPRKPKLDESGTRKSKGQRRKELDIAMLAPDILESDPKRDDRDTAFAQAYIQTVKEKLLHDQDLYEKFLTMMCDFGKGNQTPIELYQQLCMLFEHYPDLIEDFAGFLRPDEAVACDCFMINQEFQRAIEFLRKVEINFHRQPAQFQRVLKAFTKWQKTPNHSAEEVRTQIRALIKNSPILLDEFELFFPEQRVPSSHTSHPDDFEDVDLTSMDIEDDKNFDGFEEVHIPEELDTYRTKRCKCDCHINSNNAKIRSKLKHCYACCLKNVDGGLYFQPSKNKLIPVKVTYHPLPEKYKAGPPPPSSPPVFKSPASTTPMKERCRPPPPPITTSPPTPSTSGEPSVSPLKHCSLKKAKKMKLKTNKNQPGQKRFLSLNEITSPLKAAGPMTASRMRDTVTATNTPITCTGAVNVRNTKTSEVASTSRGILSMPFPTPVLHVPPPPPTFSAPSSTITSGLLSQSCDLEEFPLLANTTSSSSVLVTHTVGESDSMTGAVIRIPDNPLNLDGNISLSNFLDASRSIGLFELANEVSSKPWLFNENSTSDLLAKAVKAADISVDSNFFRNLMNSPSKSQHQFPSTSMQQQQQPLSFKGAVEPLTSTDIFTSISEVNSILANQMQMTQAGISSNIIEPSPSDKPASIFSETSVYMNSPVSTPVSEPLSVPEEPSPSDPGIQSTWTMETDKIILEMCQLHGPVDETFAIISQKLVNKTSEQVAARFQSLMEVLSECHEDSDDE